MWQYFRLFCLSQSVCNGLLAVQLEVKNNLGADAGNMLKFKHFGVHIIINSTSQYISLGRR